MHFRDCNSVFVAFNMYLAFYCDNYVQYNNKYSNSFIGHLKYISVLKRYTWV